jgi:hypothetical protein
MGVLLNLSGHPAPRGAEKLFAYIASVPVPNVDIGSADAVAAAAKSLLREALKDPAVAESLRRGEAAVVLPGATALAAAVLSLLVGLSGAFPKLYWAVKGPEGFFLSPALDLQALRLEGRALRGEA